MAAADARRGVLVRDEQLGVSLQSDAYFRRKRHRRILSYYNLRRPTQNASADINRGRLFPDCFPAEATISKPKVVIVGCGFGGLLAAQRLRHAPIDLTVLDRT